MGRYPSINGQLFKIVRPIGKSTLISKLYHVHDADIFGGVKTEFLTVPTEIREYVTGVSGVED